MTTASHTERVDAVSMDWSITKATRIFVKKLSLSLEVAKQQAKLLKEFLKEEEYEPESVFEDLNEDFHDSALVEHLSEKLELQENDEQNEKIWHALRILFLIETDNFPKLLKLDWAATKKDIRNMRRYMELQCPGLIKDGENEALLFIMAVGKKNDIKNLLTLLHDAFATYRTAHRLKVVLKIRQGIHQSDGNHHPLSAKNFCENTCLKDLPQHVRTKVAAALNAYEHRLIPGFKFLQFSALYDDKCEVFIQFTLMIAKAIKTFIKSTEYSDSSCMPLQVDLLIIPCKIVKAKSAMYNVSDSDDDDDDEDNADGDAKDDSKNNNNGVEANNLLKLFNKVMMDKYNQKFYQTEAVPSIDNEKLTRNLVSFLKEIIGNKRGQRISIVIDRRTTPNTVYIYALPEKNVIPDDFCATTMVHMCSKFVLPIWNPVIEKAEKFPFVGGGYGPGKLFQVSFQMTTDDETRMQWNFSGKGMRLTPDVMVNIWPLVFVNDELPEMYTEIFIKKELEIYDQMYDNWSEQFG